MCLQQNKTLSPKLHFQTKLLHEVLSRNPYPIIFFAKPDTPLPRIPNGIWHVHTEISESNTRNKMGHDSLLHV